MFSLLTICKKPGKFTRKFCLACIKYAKKIPNLEATSELAEGTVFVAMLNNR